MVYEFDEENAPKLESNLGAAKLVSFDTEKTLDDCGEIGVEVVFAVIADNAWHRSHFHVGLWSLDFILKLTGKG